MHPDRKPGVLRALFSAFWSVLLSSAALSLIKTAVMYAGPLLLNRLVDYTGWSFTLGCIPILLGREDEFMEVCVGFESEYGTVLLLD